LSCPAQPGHRGTDGDADLRRFGNGRDAHAIPAVFGEELMVLRRGEVLPEIQDVRIAPHFLMNSFIDGGDIGHLCHENLRAPARAGALLSSES
jgi:hypothetical protein